MSRADKKQRHRARRDAKRREARRRESVSPVKRLAEAPGEVECWGSGEMDVNRQMQVYVYKRAAGLSGLACFLIDRGVVGLKDAWVQMDLARGEIDGVLDRAASTGIRMHRIGVEEARKWIAGGMRWAHDNGMCLPKDWVRSVSLLGGVGEWEKADISAFHSEFAGHPEDLRQRLVSEPFEEYVKRQDVKFIFNEAAPYMDQRTGEYVETGMGPFEFEDLDEEDVEGLVDGMPEEEFDELARRLVPAAQGLAVETTQWLARRSEMASTELAEGWVSVMVAAMSAQMSMPPDAPDADVVDLESALLEAIIDRAEPSRQEELDLGIKQALAHLASDATLMERAIKKYGVVGGAGPTGEDGDEGR